MERIHVRNLREVRSMARSLPEEFFDNPEFQKVIAYVAQDRELCPKVRNGSLTIYDHGAALMRDIRVVPSHFIAQEGTVP
jgi:hypothetical protein